MSELLKFKPFSVGDCNHSRIVSKNRCRHRVLSIWRCLLKFEIKSNCCLCVCGLFYHLDFEQFMQNNKILFRAAMSDTRILHTTRIDSRVCLPQYKVTAPPTRFIVFARENLTRNIITTQTHKMNLICCANEPCHFHRANWQREWKRNVSNRWASIVSDDATQTQSKMSTFLSETQRIRYIHFLRFSSRWPSIFSPSKPVSLSHTRQLVI